MTPIREGALCALGLVCLIAPQAAHADPQSQTNWQRVAQDQSALLRAQQAQIEALAARLERLEAAGETRGISQSMNVPPTTEGPSSPAMSSSISTLPQTVVTPARVKPRGEQVATSAPPPGFISLPGTNASLRIGGRVQVDAMYFPDAGPGESEDFVLPRLMKNDGEGHDRSRVSARDSRFLVDFRVPSTSIGAIRAYSEIDFLGLTPANAQAQLSSYAPRMRHMFVEVGAGPGHWSLLLGQSWSAFNDLSAYADVYNGLPFGAVFVRQPQIRLTKWFSTSISLAVSVENPDGDVAGATGANTDEQYDAYPDVVVAARMERPWGSLQAGVLLREIRETEPAGRRFAWGANVSGKAKLGFMGNDYVRFQLNYGTGIGRYIGELGPGFDGDISTNGDFRLNRMFAGNISYKHFWSPRYWTVLQVSNVSVLDDGRPSLVDLRRTRTATITQVYSPERSLEFALEAIAFQKTTEDGTSASRAHARFTTRYSF